VSKFVAGQICGGGPALRSSQQAVITINLKTRDGSRNLSAVSGYTIHTPGLAHLFATVSLKFDGAIIFRSVRGSLLGNASLE
jgi:hypothetical protein